MNRLGNLRRPLSGRSGATQSEYLITVTLVALAGLSILTLFGRELVGLYGWATGSLDGRPVARPRSLDLHTSDSGFAGRARATDDSGKQVPRPDWRKSDGEEDGGFDFDDYARRVLEGQTVGGWDPAIDGRSWVGVKRFRDDPGNERVVTVVLGQDGTLSVQDPRSGKFEQVTGPLTSEEAGKYDVPRAFTEESLRDDIRRRRGYLDALEQGREAIGEPEAGRRAAELRKGIEDAESALAANDRESAYDALHGDPALMKRLQGAFGKVGDAAAEDIKSYERFREVSEDILVTAAEIAGHAGGGPVGAAASAAFVRAVSGIGYGDDWKLVTARSFVTALDAGGKLGPATKGLADGLVEVLSEYEKSGKSVSDLSGKEWVGMLKQGLAKGVVSGVAKLAGDSFKNEALTGIARVLGLQGEAAAKFVAEAAKGTLPKALLEEPIESLVEKLPLIFKATLEHAKENR